MELLQLQTSRVKEELVDAKAAIHETSERLAHALETQKNLLEDLAKGRAERQMLEAQVLGLRLRDVPKKGMLASLQRPCGDAADERD